MKLICKIYARWLSFIAILRPLRITLHTSINRIYKRLQEKLTLLSITPADNGHEKTTSPSMQACDLHSKQPGSNTIEDSPAERSPIASPAMSPTDTALEETTAASAFMIAVNQAASNKLTATTRHKQAQQLLRKHVAVSVAASNVPIPLLDVAALTATQLNLLHSLSEHYGISFDKKRGKSVLISMLSGALPATVIMGSSSLKLIPGIGTLAGNASLSVLAGATTYVTGKIFIKHYEQGGTLANFDASKQSKNFKEALRKEINARTADGKKQPV